LDRDKNNKSSSVAETEAIPVTHETAREASESTIMLNPAGRRLLAKMPLHAITSVHGEAGLRERLLMEIAQFSVPDRGRAHDALALASRLHALDRRQREPYTNHLFRVTIRVISHYRVVDPDATCAALLHDAVEDHAKDITPGGTRQRAFASLATQFGEHTAELVAAVTNPVYEPGRDRHEQYREHVATSLGANPCARIIKASDFTDNAVGLMHTTGPKLSNLARKYGPLVPTLRELILRADTPLDADVKNMIVGQLDSAEDRFAAIWHDQDVESDVDRLSPA
jgi:hypothetical protein